MKVVILAGGFGTRLAEETDFKPKPMVEVGGRPLLWHIMMLYWHYGFGDFAIALGYKGEYIKRYMIDFCAMHSSITVKTGNGQVIIHSGAQPDWTVELVETGSETMTGGRIKRMAACTGNQTFMCSYGDGLSNVNINELLAFHRVHGKLATVTAVRPIARFGHLFFDENGKTTFGGDSQAREGWINAAYFVLEPGVVDYIDGDNSIWEREPLERLAKDGQLMAYKHYGFWQCVDTLREKILLQEMWDRGNAPWKVWE